MGIYEYDNKLFSSLKKLAKYVGMNEKTLTARLRRGMSIDEACEKKDLRCSYYEDSDGIKKPLSQICREHSKNEGLIRNRIKYGYSLNKAMNTPKKISKQGKPIVVNGILYKSISMAIRDLKLEKKESTIRRRLKEGGSPDEAFSFEKF